MKQKQSITKEQWDEAPKDMQEWIRKETENHDDLPCLGCIAECMRYDFVVQPARNRYFVFANEGQVTIDEHIINALWVALKVYFYANKQ